MSKKDVRAKASLDKVLHQIESDVSRRMYTAALLKLNNLKKLRELSEDLDSRIACLLASCYSGMF